MNNEKLLEIAEDAGFYVYRGLDVEIWSDTGEDVSLKLQKFKDLVERQFIDPELSSKDWTDIGEFCNISAADAESVFNLVISKIKGRL